MQYRERTANGDDVTRDDYFAVRDGRAHLLSRNSSLAVAVGYQDIVSIANTTLNQTGQAIEAIALIMLVFLTISLGISLFMNWYNARVALVER